MYYRKQRPGKFSASGLKPKTKNGNYSMHKIIQPEGWKPARGYANGVLADGPQLYVGGQIGWNEDQVFKTSDFIAQMEQTLKNIVAIVEAAGGKYTDIVKLTWYVIDKREYLERQKEVGEAYRRVMGRHFPAMAMVVVSALVEDEALIEIEATAAFSPQA
jgi:enamine deaminase RidA (YjgF/YER057c/UK114 family)